MNRGRCLRISLGAGGLWSHESGESRVTQTCLGSPRRWGFSTSTERCWGEDHSNDSLQIIATYSPPVGYPNWWFSKGNPLQHLVLSGLEYIVSCPDDWICWDENIVFKQSLSPFVPSIRHGCDINLFCWRICDLLVWTFLYNCHELAISNLYHQ